MTPNHLFTFNFKIIYMKIFLRKLIIVSIPLCFIMFFPCAVILLGREAVSFKEVVRIQELEPRLLFGFAYNAASFYPYKKYLVEIKQPKVIALGTSRVMQFRSDFFKNDSSFINAGGAGRSMEDIELFMHELHGDGSVKIVILGIDKEVITDTYSSKDKKSEEFLPVRFIKITVSVSRRIYLDYFAGKYTLSGLYKASKSSDNIGLSALLHGDGFRVDGSYRYGGSMSNPERLAVVSSQVESAVLEAKSVSDVEIARRKINLENNLRTLEKVIISSKEKGIIIIGFMPPYPTSLYKQLHLSDPSLVSTEKALAEIFERNNLPFFNASNLAGYDGKDSEFFDFIHGTDFMYSRILLSMSNKFPALGQHVNGVMLQNIIKNKKNDFLFF